MKEVQGFLAIIPNVPDGRGLLFFSKDVAIAYRDSFNNELEKMWNSGKFNTDFWKEKPEPAKVFSLVVKEEI